MTTPILYDPNFDKLRDGNIITASANDVYLYVRKLEREAYTAGRVAEAKECEAHIDRVKEWIRKECERMKREVGQNHWDGTDLNSYKEGHNSALANIITYLDTI